MFLRETAYNIALPLTLIFRKSLDEGVLPCDVYVGGKVRISEFRVFSNLRLGGSK